MNQLIQNIRIGRSQSRFGRYFVVVTIAIIAMMGDIRLSWGQSSKQPTSPSLLASSSFGTNAAKNASKDIILVWNQVMLDASANDSRSSSPDQPGPCRQSRAFAIVSVAMFDAWNSIHHRYQPFLTELEGKGADEGAAVSKAALDTLSALFPQQTTVFQAAFAASVKLSIKSTSKTRGLELGRQVALAILNDRKNDHSDSILPYTFVNQPGYHQPDPLHPNQGVYASHWGLVDPFVICDVSSRLAPPPPALDSTEYAMAFQQVKDLGGDGVTTPTLRSPEQTIIGMYWGYDGTPGLGTPPRLYNQIVRTIALQNRNSVEENARLFALVNLAMADAAIQCWYCKYTYEFWRPVIGIANADNDGNSSTDGDPLWLPLGAPATNGAGDGVNFTPPFPAYSSGHATFGSASLNAVANFYGTRQIPFTFVSDEFNGVNRDATGNVRPVVIRSFNNLDDAIWENAFSRIYLGIHWIFDATAGVSSGEIIADEVFSSALLPKSGKVPKSRKPRQDSELSATRD
jgi:hypothetical protein